MLKTLLMILVTRRGRGKVVGRFGVGGWQDFMEAIELLLCFVAWAAQDQFWDCSSNDGEEDALRALKQMMRSLRKLAPRTKGQGWNITKVHEIKHMAHDITRYGSPSNTNTGPTEHHHIKHAKNPAKTVRHDRFHFDKSVADRYVDNLILDLVAHESHAHLADPLGWHDDMHQQQHLSTDSESNSPSVKQSFDGATTVEVEFSVVLNNRNEECIRVVQDWKTRSRNKCSFSDELLDFLACHIGIDKMNDGDPSVTVKMFTEYHRNDTTFRAHPNLQGQGPWNDWVCVHWQEHGRLPAQIQAFFHSPVADPGDEKQCIVHSVVDKGNRYSVLTRLHELEVTEEGTPDCQVVSVNSLGHHTCMFPHDPESVHCFELLPHGHWADQFISYSSPRANMVQVGVPWDGDFSDKESDA